MRALSTAALLDAWERGVGQLLCQRALTLLAAACPDIPPDRLARLPMGRRNSRLLGLRELTFGPRLNGVVRCPRCLAQLDLTFNLSDTRLTSATDDGQEGAEQDQYTLTFDQREVTFRLPNSLDLAAVGSDRDLGRARKRLLERCVLSITDGGSPPSIDAAPPQLLDAIVEHMAQVDPQGDVQMMFTCPSCHHTHEIAFDIASFFWNEIDAWALRTLKDVHALATAYGWREADILAISPHRRQRYLDLVGG